MELFNALTESNSRITDVNQHQPVILRL